MRVLCHPDQSLTRPATKVTSFDSGLHRLGAGLIEKMYATQASYLTAPQVGIDSRVMAVDVEGSGPIVLVNPVILWSSKETQSETEGCESIPDIFLYVERSSVVEVEFMTMNCDRVVSHFDGWTSRLVQHGIDHLCGIVMLDRVDGAVRDTMLDCYSPPSSTKENT